MDGAPVRIVLVEKQSIIGAGIRLLLAERREFALVHLAANAAEALTLLAAQPDAVDVILADLTGDGAAARLLAQARGAQPRVRVVALTMRPDDEQLRALLALGADGYVSKHDAVPTLFAALQAAMRGGPFVSPLLGRAMAALREREQEGQEHAARLSVREQEILGLIAEGLTSKGIAQRLGISPKTIDNHRARILGKLDASSSAEATARLGLVRQPRASE